MIGKQRGVEDREEELNAILLAYVEAEERGETPNRYQLLAPNVEFAAELLDYFKIQDHVDRLAAPMRAAVQTGESDLGELGDFRLLQEIGRGGMGVVYEAEQLSLQRHVALKVLPFAAALDPRQLKRFQNEARAAASLHHPNIVAVYAVGSVRGVHYYAMQLIEGQSLAALLDDLRRAAELPVASAQCKQIAVTTQGAAARATERTGSKRSFQRTAVLMRQAAAALEYAHQAGIVHRDVKPANLLLDGCGELLIADFGLAQFSNDAGLTQTGELIGTLRYASPEQALAKRGLVDHRTDIYSLGVTFYELLTLTPVFAGRDRQELLHQIAYDEPQAPRTLNAAIPVELETIVLKAVAKNSAERYASARDLADDLQRFLDDQPILARRPSLLDRMTKWARRHRSLVAAGVVLLLFAVFALGVSNVLIARARHQADEAFVRERQKATEADEQRRLADKRFHQAQRSVDRFTQLAEEQLAGGPFQHARRKFLEAALLHYREFLEDAGDDPAIQEELNASKVRVTSILKELTEQEGAGRYLLLSQRDVQDDLKPTAEQRAQLLTLATRMDEQGRELFRDFLQLTAAERQRHLLDSARSNEAAATTILTPEQLQRLTQIDLQQHLPFAFLDETVVKELRLTAAQQQRIRVLHEEMGQAMLRAMEPERRPEGSPGPPTQVFLRTTQKIIDEILTPPQREQWRKLVGAPFTGAPRKWPPGGLLPPPFPGR